ncbi:hypothetical protein evm_012840 [Chilo suppressalis]|nr:hypothetical protein evm_012840 [Chilo suppressalis]
MQTAKLSADRPCDTAIEPPRPLPLICPCENGGHCVEDATSPGGVRCQCPGDVGAGADGVCAGAGAAARAGRAAAVTVALPVLLVLLLVLAAAGAWFVIRKRPFSDPGSEFNNALLKELLSLYKVDLHIGTPNNPNSMGLIERFHSTIIEIYRLAKHVLVLLVASMTTRLCKQELNRNPGILPLRNGVAVLSKDKWIIAKVLDFTPIREDLKFNIDRLTELDKVKRGLINPLGSIIKVIIGNLDHDDAIRYDKLLKDVKSKQNSNNRKLTLITETVQVLTNSTLQLNSNLIKLNKEIVDVAKNLSKELWKEHFEVQIINTYNILLHNFQVIHTKLNEIG